MHPPDNMIGSTSLYSLKTQIISLATSYNQKEQQTTQLYQAKKYYSAIPPPLPTINKSKALLNGSPNRDICQNLIFCGCDTNLFSPLKGSDYEKNLCFLLYLIPLYTQGHFPFSETLWSNWLKGKRHAPIKHTFSVTNGQPSEIPCLLLNRLEQKLPFHLHKTSIFIFFAFLCHNVHLMMRVTKDVETLEMRTRLFDQMKNKSLPVDTDFVSLTKRFLVMQVAQTHSL